jgi:hypothetical protein
MLLNDLVSIEAEREAHKLDDFMVSYGEVSIGSVRGLHCA